MVKKLGLLLILIVFALTNNAFSQEKNKEISVIATGTGIDSNNATKNAIRAAVEQAVGAYISSETITKNSILLDDKIFMFSEGYVEKMKIISTRNEGGLVHVKIEAVVVGDKLRQKLQQLGIATVEVEGESLFGEAFSRAEEKEDKGIIFFNALTKIRKQGLVSQVSKPKLIKSESGTAEIEVPFSVKWNPAFIENLREALFKISNPSHEPIPWARCKDICFTKKSLMGQDRVQILVSLLNNYM